MLMNGKCSCANGYVVYGSSDTFFYHRIIFIEYIDGKTGVQTNKCIPFKKCNGKFKQPIFEENQKQGKNFKSVNRIWSQILPEQAH